MSLHYNLDFDSIARAAIAANPSWFKPNEISGAVEMIVADYEMGTSFARSFGRIANTHSVAASLSVFASFLKADVVMDLHKDLQAVSQ